MKAKLEKKIELYAAQTSEREWQGLLSLIRQWREDKPIKRNEPENMFEESLNELESSYIFERSNYLEERALERAAYISISEILNQ